VHPAAKGSVCELTQSKLAEVRQAWRRGKQDRLPPILVTEIDGELSLIDGHSRVLAAYESGATKIGAEIRSLKEIEGSRALYKHIHREGPRRGIETIADLADRVLEADDHRKAWVGYCSNWLAENEV